MNFSIYGKAIQCPEHQEKRFWRKGQSFRAIEISTEFFHSVVLENTVQMRKHDFEVKPTRATTFPSPTTDDQLAQS